MLSWALKRLSFSAPLFYGGLIYRLLRRAIPWPQTERLPNCGLVSLEAASAGIYGETEILVLLVRLYYNPHVDRLRS